MRPTVSQARAWRPSDLDSRASAVERATAATVDHRTILSDGREAIEDGWKGMSADVVTAHADAEMAVASTLLQRLDDLASAVRTASSSLAGARETVLRKIADAEADGFVVDDAGVRPVDGAATEDSGARARDHAEAIDSALTVLGSIDDEQGRALSAVADALRDAVPQSGAIGATEGEKLAEITTDGHLTAEDLGRLRADLTAAGITPEILDRLARGEQAIDLPAGSVEFLTSFYGKAGVNGLLSLQEQLRLHGGTDASTVSAQVGDGLLTLSNERLGDAGGGRGGYAQVPDSVRALVEGRPVPGLPAGSPFARTGDYNAPQSAGRAALNDGFWKSMSSGRAQPGAELGTRLIMSAARQASVAEAPMTSRFFTEEYDHLHLPGQTAAGTGQAMLDLASRNHEAATRVLTGDLDGNAATPPIDRDAILTPLFHRDWGDGGAALAKNLDWMTDEMKTPPGSAEWKRGGTASFALAQYLSDENNHKAFTDMRGAHSANIGEINSGLVQGLERGLEGTIGYLAHAVPVPDGLPGWSDGGPGGTAPLESSSEKGHQFDHAKRIATILSMDSEADARFGLEVSRLSGDLLQHPGEGSAIAAGQLRGLSDAGEFEVQKEMQEDHHLSPKEAYDQRKKNFEAVADVIKDGLPGGRLVSLPVDGGKYLFEDSVIGNEPALDSSKTTDLHSGVHTTMSSLRDAVSAALANGTISYEDAGRVAGLFDGNGNLKSASELAGNTVNGDLASNTRELLKNAGIALDRDDSTSYGDGYTAVRPLNMD